MNPTTDVLEQRVRQWKEVLLDYVLPQGWRAITYAIQCITESGDNIVSTSQLYGGTYNLFAHSLSRQGVEASFMVSHDDFEGFERPLMKIQKQCFVNP